MLKETLGMNMKKRLRHTPSRLFGSCEKLDAGGDLLCWQLNVEV